MRSVLSRWKIKQLICFFSIIFLIILVYNYHILMSFQNDNNIKKEDPLEKIKQIESQLEAHESNDKVSKLEKRLEDLEKLIEERLPSLQESIISDNRMERLNGRLSKLESKLALLDKERKTLNGAAAKLEAFNYRLENLAKNSPGGSMHIGNIRFNDSCKAPNDWLFPFCAGKIKWLRDNWDQHYRCYIDLHALDIDDTCSVMIFLSEVEAWCPKLEFRKNLHDNKLDNKNKRQAILKRQFYDLMAMMKPEYWRWMRQRIRRLWESWIKGLDTLMNINHPVEHHFPKRIFLYMGSFANSPQWFKQAFTGAPLGELVQWSDLIAALFILGHNIVICTRKEEVKNHLNMPLSRGCASKARPDEYDLVFTDYVGITYLKKELGPNFSQYRCRMRILDSFGTEAEFNYINPMKPPMTRKRSSWGGENLQLRQFMTMFPHTPDNTFLGFVVEVNMDIAKPVKTEPGKKPIGLVYGKDAKFWTFKDKYLEQLSKYFEIHGTVTGTRMKTFVPSWVKNHNILGGHDYQDLLSKSKIYIGLGFPYDGPAPLEAIAHGSVFLNAKLNPVHSRDNTDFFKEKPTSRKLASQHPYAERFIGKPHVYTIDIKNSEEVEKAVKEILQLEVKPYIPYEWTPAGMLERVNALVSNQNFCDKNIRWPPPEELHLYVSKVDRSCSETCEEYGLLCESSFFQDINNLKSFKRAGLQCTSSYTKDSFHAPSSSSVDQSCLLQKTSLLYSCSTRSPIYTRLCPCRDYKPQQVALCKNCT